MPKFCEYRTRPNGRFMQTHVKRESFDVRPIDSFREGTPEFMGRISACLHMSEGDVRTRIVIIQNDVRR